MSGSERTIIAASAWDQRDYPWRATGRHPLLELATEITGKSRPNICFVTTAAGDDPGLLGRLVQAATTFGARSVCLPMFGDTTPAQAADGLFSSDLIWIEDGSLLNALEIWRLYGVDRALAEAVEAGAVMVGVGAGSLCLHQSGLTASLDPTLRPFNNGLGLVGGGNAVNLDVNVRTAVTSALNDGAISAAICATEPGVGLVYRDGSLLEAVSQREGGQAARFERLNGRVVETALNVRQLSKR